MSCDRMFDTYGSHELFVTRGAVITPLLFGRVVLVLLLSGWFVVADEWGRFRGAEGTGISNEKAALPEKIGPGDHLLWKTELPPGISSPVVGGGRVFVTTMEPGPKLSTVALDAGTGRIVWREVAPIHHKTKRQRLATPTPTTDGKLVVTFFGSSGLFCYDVGGTLLWSKDFGPLKNQFNHAASPILIEDRVILLLDHDGDSFLVALDKRTGKELWRSYRFVLGRNYASPIVWKQGDQASLVVAGSGLIVGYDIETGTAQWFVRGTAAVVNPTPIVGDNGWLYTHGNSPDSGAKSSRFGPLLQQYDRDRDSRLQSRELPKCFLKAFFDRFDRDTNGGIDEREYTSQFEALSRPFAKGLSAWKPSENGTAPTLAWTLSRSMPRTPSALCRAGVLYVVNEGGHLHSIDADTGKIICKDRIAARGTVYSSPSLGDGKIYIGTRSGNVAVLAAKAQWENLHSAKLDGEIQASPAIATAASTSVRTRPCTASAWPSGARVIKLGSRLSHQLGQRSGLVQIPQVRIFRYRTTFVDRRWRVRDSDTNSPSSGDSSLRTWGSRGIDRATSADHPSRR